MDKQQVAREQFADVIPRRIWIRLSNIESDGGKFKVTLEINGQDRPVFHSYPNREDGLVCESHNLTWLIHNATKSLEARLAKAEADCARMRSALHQSKDARFIHGDGCTCFNCDALRPTSGQAIYDELLRLRAKVEEPEGCPNESWECKKIERELNSELYRLRAQIGIMAEALVGLKNEAAGFVSMASMDIHGHTNIQCLKNRINRAEQILAQLASDEATDRG